MADKALEEKPGETSKRQVDKSAGETALDATLCEPNSQAKIAIFGDVEKSTIIAGNNNNVVNNLILNQPAPFLHQLPPAPADFVGRESELSKILEREGATVYCISGMGGIGKTTLGLVAAHKLAEKYQDAQFFLDLQGVSSTPMTQRNIMINIIVSFNPIIDPLKFTDNQLHSMYLSLLSNKHALLFFDNAQDAFQVRSLLPPPGNVVLITSRTYFTLEGMGEPFQLDLLSDTEAHQLLTKICPRVAWTAHKLAKLCGYLPLALRIAATFMVEHQDWTPDEYLERLEKQRLKTLKVEYDFKQNVDTIFELSYSLLNDDEKSRWCALSVFADSFNLNALAAVCSLDEDHARDFAGKMCRNNLLGYDNSTNRYHIHDLLRDFASLRLSSAEDFDIRKKHAKFFAALADKIENLYFQDEGRFGLLFQYLYERKHIETALDWSSQNIENGMADVALRLSTNELSYTLFPPRNKIIEQLKITLRAARFLNNIEYEYGSLNRLGYSYYESGDMHHAIEFYEQALAVSRNYDGHKSKKRGAGLFVSSLFIFSFNKMKGQDYYFLGKAYYSIGKFHQAINSFKKALSIFHEIDNYLDVSILNDIGIVYISLNEISRAIKYFEKALNLSRKMGFPEEEEGNTLLKISYAFHEIGDIVLARHFGKKALDVFYTVEFNGEPYIEKAKKWLKELE